MTVYIYIHGQFYGFMSSLKKCSDGSRPHIVGKRTPRFPDSHSYEIEAKSRFCPTRKGLKLGDDSDEDVAQSITMVLAEAFLER